MSASIKVQGTRQLERQMRIIGKRAPKWASDIVQASARVYEQFARSYAPERKGKLKESIESVKLPGTAPVWVVRPDYNIAPHAHLVEFGTKKRFQIKVDANGTERRVNIGSMKPNPFMRRAFSAGSPKALTTAKIAATQRFKLLAKI